MGLGPVCYWVYLSPVIKSFADITTETLFLGIQPSRKELKKLGGLNLKKVFERLSQLDAADEKTLLPTPALHYHLLQGTRRYSIDADARNSPWRITFEWDNAEMKDVQLVKIEDTH
jgi:plasmid maintenance system killer protein